MWRRGSEIWRFSCIEPGAQLKWEIFLRVNWCRNSSINSSLFLVHVNPELSRLRRPCPWFSSSFFSRSAMCPPWRPDGTRGSWWKTGETVGWRKLPRALECSVWSVLRVSCQSHLEMKHGFNKALGDDGEASNKDLSFLGGVALAP